MVTVLSAHAACTGLEQSDLLRVLLHLQHVVRPEGLSPQPAAAPITQGIHWTKSWRSMGFLGE